MNNINTLQIGRYIEQKEGYRTFTPFDFPPKSGFVISPKLHKKHEEAIRLVGKLDGITRLLPDKNFFLLMFIKKDAAYSSQIEGTKATFQDAVAAPVTEEKSQRHPDVDDIVHYVDAVNYGIERTKTLPISLRLIREIHLRLMTKARSTQHAYPGEFRRSQNWIGGKTPTDASFVPPAPLDMQKSLDNLEKFVHTTDEYPSLVKTGLIHAQFETIHPFTDGNGRTGRMLIAMYIHHAGLLELPVLYLSSYFKRYQKLYYQKLQDYHDENAQVDAWLEFFLEGVAEIANSSIETCAKITVLRDSDFAKMQKLGKKSAESTLEIIRKLFGQPIVGVAEIMKWTSFSPQGAYNVIKRLENLKILEPLGDAVYGQKYIYADYYEIFDDAFREARAKKK
ncbi:MAG: Filamentation induced by cAMP protein Fic [Candidatus Roizmanbacteria bacterium GW2011_GWC2_41_7]|uniref:Filamentation induced by cAMP protein Fic n=1 Tax=Candidatus Roizmanbacteria bacterium GW2011_GWC2_41_7 TaxID=1618487 RepID=A0A0G0XBA7_9BACT|nr:MAG: Filamentation induced by cAMP protein Fic [Candidatus Roizmanbacteria bacterium GW2011_GWC2_41_7]KKS40502.1 MAG: Filamentation induced by cAMP protein Fic [Candidatus Gottesmanbacteria bacterium GW2011_GWA2_42_16]KKS80693.1 MAG: Filamentation induced by cAMP protein Fic [Candidatus Gottesmanbacteria bacterium GW2011_GWC1_43_10]